jgi:enoyl-CoA hydratase/carnithine racemase
MADQPVLLEKHEDGRIWVITLNRPERMNAISGALRHALYEYWEEFGKDRSARVAIITGSGDRSFCAGMDLRERAEYDARGERPPTFRTVTPVNETLEVWKPVIAAINGFSLAGGFNLALQCDIRIAAEHAEFGIPEVRWNLGASWVQILPRLIGLGHALELAMWGDKRISAQRAYEMGFVNKVVPKEKLMEEAMDWAKRAINLAPRSMANLKQILHRAYYMGPMEARAFGQALEQNLVGMEDSVEGPKAFSEKRLPVFKNR